MPTESLFPPLDIPNVDLWSFFFEKRDIKYPEDKVIYLDPDTKRSYNYTQVRNASIDFGKGLRSLFDWRKGDTLALFSPNSIDAPPIIWGTHWAGGKVSPANPGYTVEELAFQLKDSEAKAIVTQKPLLPVVLAAAKQVGLPNDRIILMGDARDETGRFKHFTSIRNISGTTRFRRAKIDPDNELAFLVYSSGTTGHPKGVMLSHRNIISNVLQGRAVELGKLSWNGGADGRGDRMLAFLPFFHIYGLTCLMHLTMYAGYELVVMLKFDIERFCQIVQDHRITYAYIVPPIVLLLGKHPIVDKYDLSSLRMLNSGAAPLTKELVEACYERLKVPIKQGYGLSETSPTTHTQPWEDWNKHLGSVGLLLPSQTAKYVDADTGAEVPAGSTGELWVRGPNVFKGYWHNASQTAHALTADGYFKTGDVGHQDAAGHFWITDRVKELIKYKGFQVPPAELEGLLVTHPCVADVAVVGVHIHHQATEVPRAYVALAKGVPASKETEKALVDWLAERVANHKRLRGGVRFVAEVPKSASGKILRRVLRERAKKEEEEEDDDDDDDDVGDDGDGDEQAGGPTKAKL
ncbi:MAG: hypothetical protein M1819_004414 [Sarea resinae]|nr:MAG: hypothetical protein M1819_004414 [Sarea resinae]